jgi:clusterin-associated protein 1
MSYRELKNFTEIMKTLRYPRVISLNSFKTPNFELVADILYWLTQRYDPNIPIHDEIGTEQDRILFITGIVKAIYEQSPHDQRIKLNAHKLYAADGYAVRELLKVASFLQNAISMAKEHDSKTRKSMSSKSENNDLMQVEDNPSNQAESYSSFFINPQKIKQVRNLASEVMDYGAKLHDLIQIEIQNKDDREAALNYIDQIVNDLDQGPEAKDVAMTLMQLVNQARDNVERLTQEWKKMESDKKELEEQIKKKTIDLERNEKRLESLKTARPTFMNEFESLEMELHTQYELFMERFRNVHYLKKEIEKYEMEEKKEMLKAEKSVQKVQKKLREEELQILHGEDVDNPSLMASNSKNSDELNSIGVLKRNGTGTGSHSMESPSKDVSESSILHLSADTSDENIMINGVDSSMEKIKTSSRSSGRRIRKNSNRISDSSSQSSTFNGSDLGENFSASVDDSEVMMDDSNDSDF